MDEKPTQNLHSENLQKPTNSLVPTKYYDMFTYRLMGLTYEQIAEKTGYTPQWVRELFAKGGRLYSLWQQWLKTAKESSVDDVFTMMFGHLPDITRMRIMEAKSLGANAIASTKIIYKNTIDKVAQNDDKNEEDASDLSEERKAEILKAFSNFYSASDKPKPANSHSERSDTGQKPASPSS